MFRLTTLVPFFITPNALAGLEGGKLGKFQREFGSILFYLQQISYFNNIICILIEYYNDWIVLAVSILRIQTLSMKILRERKEKKLEREKNSHTYR